MIAIIHTTGFNLSSVQFALKHLGYESVLTADPTRVRQASHVILPGVGSCAYAMKQLQADGLPELICSLKQPVLGLCLGMQLMYEYSQEGHTPCLGIFPGRIEHLATKPGVTMPHMGWNQLEINKPAHPLLEGIPNNSYVYFVHSYAAPVNTHTVALTHYSQPFTSVVHKDNFYATQFHPERSSDIGLRLMQNFLNL